MLVVEGAEAGEGALREVFLPASGTGVTEVDPAAERAHRMHAAAPVV
jgi:hypothetical protein